MRPPGHRLWDKAVPADRIYLVLEPLPEYNGISIEVVNETEIILDIPGPNATLRACMVAEFLSYLGWNVLLD